MRDYSNQNTTIIASILLKIYCKTCIFSFTLGGGDVGVVLIRMNMVCLMAEVIIVCVKTES